MTQRIQVTLSRSLHDAVCTLSDLTGASRSRVIANLLEPSASRIQQYVAAMRRLTPNGVITAPETLKIISADNPDAAEARNAFYGIQLEIEHAIEQTLGAEKAGRSE